MNGRHGKVYPFLCARLVRSYSNHEYGFHGALCTTHESTTAQQRWLLVSVKAKAAAVGMAAILIVAGIGLVGAWVTVPEGYVGVQTERQASTGEVYEPGWHMQLPIVQGYEEIETRDRTVTYSGDDSIQIITEDGQDVFVDVTVRYSVAPDDAPTFFEVANDHSQAQDRFIEPNVRSDVRDEGSDMSARDVITKDGRLQLEEAAVEALQENFDGTGMTVEAVAVRSVQPNAEFSEELEQIEIENAKADQRLIEAEAEADAEIARAEGDASAAEIRDEQLTDDVLMDKWLDSIDDNDKIIVTDGSGEDIIIDTETGE